MSEPLRCNSVGGGGGNDAYTIAIAAPENFSLNPETNTRDQHTFRLSLGDWARRTNVYVTGGTADHQHEIPFPAEFLFAIQTYAPIVATTGPPLGDVGGHTHTVMVVQCAPIPGG
jgi:hypothetical protein